MAASRTGVLLVNLGTPNSPSVKDVRVYLREFLMDGRVIDIPYWRRFLLVNGIIAPFRSIESAKGYQQLWQERGSPLKFYGEDVRDLLQESLGDEYEVFLAMRYQSPSIPVVLEKMRKRAFKKLVIIPLYPQYASASTGSTIEKVMQHLRQWEVIPEQHVVSDFFDHPLFIQGFVERGREHLEKGKFDHILFSYHGLPQRQIRKAAVDGYCQLSDKCCATMHQKNKYCYRAQCYATSRLLARGLGLSHEQYAVSFQSRLGRDPWIKPYTDEVIADLCRRGIKSLLVFSPAFVADCLETTVEISTEYDHLFREKGGERLELVESLNTSSTWIQCLKELVLDRADRKAEVRGTALA